MAVLEYRISAAQFAATAVITVCFLIAVIMVGTQAGRRARPAGVVGLLLVLGSVLVQALTGSLAGAYGRDTAGYAAGSLVAAVLAAAGSVLVAVGVLRAQRSRGSR